jgi:electron transfer flavoprotein beta subunit
MKIIVCVKQVLDTAFNLEMVPVETFPRQQFLPRFQPGPVYEINPADHCAFEVAMALQSQVQAEVVAITLGSALEEDALRLCLVRGVDRAIHLRIPPGAVLDSWIVSELLSREILKIGFDLILCGDQSQDTCNSQVGPVLAELLDIPQVTRGVEVDLDMTSRQITVQKLLERGARQFIQCQLPAMVTIKEYANNLPYIAGIRRKRVPDELIEKVFIPLSEETVTAGCQVQKLTPPRPRPRKISHPGAKMSASERIKFLMAGGISARPESNIFEGTPDAAAERIIDFLREEEMLD